MSSPRYPALYQINTRVRLTELSQALGRAATLDDFSDAELDRLAALGFDWIWLLSVWQTGAAARRVSRSQPDWRQRVPSARCPTCATRTSPARASLSAAYTVHAALGGDAALARLRERLRAAWAEADARLRAQPRGAGPSVGTGASRVLHRRQR